MWVANDRWSANLLRYRCLNLRNTMHKPPLLTVVIPSFQRCNLLRRAVSSLNQSGCEEIVVLISDNASSDGTEEYVRSLNHPFRLQYIRNAENIGLLKNLFQASLAVSTPYQLWLTDDDYLFEGSLRKVLNAIKLNPDCGFGLSHVHSLEEDAAPSAVPMHIIGPSYVNHQIEGGVEAVIDYARYAWVYSRQMYRTDCIDFSFWRRHLLNSYIPLLIAGRVLSQYPCFYLADSIVAHTVCNKVYWEELGDTPLEIRIRTATDYCQAFRAIFDDAVPTLAIQNAIHNWELGCHESYDSSFRQLLGSLQAGASYRVLRKNLGVPKPLARDLVVRSRSKIYRKAARFQSKWIMNRCVTCRYLPVSSGRRWVDRRWWSRARVTDVN